MPQPVLLAVDGDPAAMTLILGELRKRYGADYQVLGEGLVPVGVPGPRLGVRPWALGPDLTAVWLAPPSS